MYLTCYDSWMWAKPNRGFCRNTLTEWWPPKKGAAVRRQTSSTLVVHWFSTIFFLSYYFLKFDDFIFYFQETYNSQLKERYGDNPSTHPDFDPNLWLETRSSGGLDRNWVYGLSNIMAENLQMACSVSTVGCSQSILSTHSPEFTALLDQGVQERTTHLNKKYEWLSVEYEELCRMVMDIRSQMSGTYTPPIGPTIPGTTSLLLL